MDTRLHIAVVCLLATSLPLAAVAQEVVAPPGPELDTAARPQVVAVDGQPFGVLVVEVPLPPDLQAQLSFNRAPVQANGAQLGAESGADLMPEEPQLRLLISDSENRVFYPAFRVKTIEAAARLEVPPRILRGRGRPGGLLDRLRSAIRGESKPEALPVAVTVFALYRGSGPIDLRLSGDLQQRLEVETASPSPPEHAALLAQWWSAYADQFRQSLAANDFPTLVHKYLAAMLADRLELPRVDWSAPEGDSNSSGATTSQGDQQQDQPLKTLALLAAIEPLREEILEDVLRNPPAEVDAQRALPPEPVWEPAAVAPIDGGVAVEDIAGRIPPECFYLRFGSFRNFVWFKDLAGRFGGDIAQAVVLRGFNYDATARLERMMAARMTQLAKMFGDNLISDLALIGTDLYMKEGASMGVVFQARNADLLLAAIRADRQAAADRTPGATFSEVEIEGRRVMLLSTPDNRLRSFLVSDGAYVFVTTSQNLVARFLQVGSGGQSLAQSPHFRWSRTWMPEAHEYSVFAYFSPEFFQNLVSPQYQIELRRRLEAIAHLEIATMASQVARAEGHAADDLSQLLQAGLIPQWFDLRPDGARTLRGEGRWVDSLRGARGSFLPIADVTVHSVTPRELDNYNRISAYYQEK